MAAPGASSFVAVRSPLRRFIARVALLITIVAAAWALFLLVFGGFDAQILGVTITTHEPSRPIILTVVGLLVFLSATGLHDVAAALRDTLAFYRDISARLDGPIVAVLAVAVLAVGVGRGSKAAGGGDSYGYISEAELFLSGHLTIPQPWAKRAPWPDSVLSFAPLGYIPSVDEQSIVPVYSPGLPLMMAAAKRLAGHCALFWVVPLCGAVLILTTFGIGRRIGSRAAGVIAAWLVATSPVFIYQVLQPMSDVPAAAAWTTTVWCALGGTAGWAVASGVSAALAVLIRPNLAPLAAVIVVWMALDGWWRQNEDRRHVAVRVMAFLLALAPGVATVAALNQLWYGSPFRSGYGSLGDLFSIAHVLPNIRQYSAWVTETQTPLAYLGLLALAFPLRSLWPPGALRSTLVLVAAFTLVLCSIYFTYQVWDSWFYLRFLLPCWPYIMLGVAAVLLWPARGRHPMIGVGVALLVILLGYNGWRDARKKGAFEIRDGEDKFPAAAAVVRARTDPTAVVITNFHSGSVRYYGGRLTIGFFGLNQHSLDRAVAWLVSRGAHPYALLEQFEIAEFRQRFADQTLGKLDIPPIAVMNRSDYIYLYDLLVPVGSTDAVENVADTSTRACMPPAPPPPVVLK